MKLQKTHVAIIALLMCAGLILVHQLVNWGMLFNPDDFLHHENFALLLVAFAGGLSVPVIVVFWKKNKGKPMKKTHAILLAGVLITGCGIMITLACMNGQVGAGEAVETRINVVDRSVLEGVRDHLDFSTYRYLLTEFSNGGGVNYAVYKVTDLVIVAELIGQSLTCTNGTGKIFHNPSNETGIFFMFAFDIAEELQFFMTHSPVDMMLFDFDTVLNDVIEVAA